MDFYYCVRACVRMCARIATHAYLPATLAQLTYVLRTTQCTNERRGLGWKQCTRRTPQSHNRNGRCLAHGCLASPRLTRTAHYPLRRLAWSDQSETQPNRRAKRPRLRPAAHWEGSDINFCCFSRIARTSGSRAQYAWRREVRW